MANGMTTEPIISRQYILAGTAFGEGGPSIVLDAAPPATPGRMHFRVVGQSFTLERCEATFCTGRYSLDTYEDWPCPNQSKVDVEYSECPACRKFNGFTPAFYRVPRSSLSPQQRRYNDRPHAVYLAHFGGDRIKVGISSVDRIRIRLMEQGARVAYILVYCESAYDARSIEAAISGVDGVSEVVHSKTKRALLAMPFDGMSALCRLRELGVRIAQRLSLSVRGECINCTRDYLLGGALEPSIADVTSANPFRISGTGIGIIGTVLIVATASRQYMASLSEAVGHIVTVAETVVPNPCVPGQTQLKLF